MDAKNNENEKKYEAHMVDHEGESSFKMTETEAKDMLQRAKDEIAAAMNRMQGITSVNIIITTEDDVVHIAAGPRDEITGGLANEIIVNQSFAEVIAEAGMQAAMHIITEEIGKHHKKPDDGKDAKGNYLL